MKVLIVDDDVVSRMMLMHMIDSAAGGVFDVLEAEDGGDAWEQLDGGAGPAIVFCDLRMPRLSGMELLARVKADARFAGYAFDAASRTLVREHDGQAVALTTGEFDLLAAFVARPNQVLSRDDLIGALHGREAGPYDRSIDMQVGRLRRKIEADPADPQLIKSVRGAGYLFAARIERT